MILQARAVMRGSRRALVVVDMPFGSYEESREQAFRNAARVLKETGAGAIKMEGGAHMAETVAFLVRRGVPSMLISMNREYHGTWSVPSNLLRTQLYLQEWFDCYPGEEDEGEAAD